MERPRASHLPDPSPQSPGDAPMPKREQRDVELDKRIEALRRKNEALMKRHQEVEEDKKRAEQEGMPPPQSRKGKADDLTITVNKSPAEPRVVVARPGVGPAVAPAAPVVEGSKPSGVEDDLMSRGRGRRRQILVTMAGNRVKGVKRVVSERTDRKPWSPACTEGRSLAEDGNQQRVDSAGRGKRPPTPKRNPGAQEEVGQVHRQGEECFWLSECDQDTEGFGRSPGPADLTLLTTREEQEEYLRWKTEREEIDRQRVARHKNAKGQWRRAWDMDKTENMFSDKSAGERERGPPTRGATLGGRGARRGQPKSNTDSRGSQTRVRGEKRGKAVPVVSSKAKGKDRLTGRARRWDADEEGEELFQASETSLEEFLEELDALADPEVDDPAAEAPEVTEGDPKMASSPVLDVVQQQQKQQDDHGEVSGAVAESVEVTGPTGPAPATPSAEDTPKPEALSPKGPEKKVRFSDEIVRGGCDYKPGAGAQNSAASETEVAGSLKDLSPGEVSPDAEEPARAAKDALVETGTAPDQGDAPAGDSRLLSSSNGRGRQPRGPEVPVASRPDCAESIRDSVPASTPISNADEKPCVLPRGNSVQPLEHAKSNSNRNTEELIDSSLSVLNLELGESDPTRTTSTDKARENGKIV